MKLLINVNNLKATNDLTVVHYLIFGGAYKDLIHNNIFLLTLI